MSDVAWIDPVLRSARPQAVGALVRYFRSLDQAEEVMVVGDLHGNLFRHFLNSSAYQSNFRKPPVRAECRYRRQ